MSHLTDFLGKLDQDKLRRLGAALWARIGSRIELSDLTWALSLFGPSGDQLVWDAAREAGVIDAEGVLLPGPLARWLGILSRGEVTEIEDSRLVWTLPPQHPEAGLLGDSYKNALIEAIAGAEHELILVSPFLHERGVVLLTNALLQALWRKVEVTVITQQANEISSDQSRALEHLRKEAELSMLPLHVYVETEKYGGMLHAKIAIADSRRLVIGSANITGAGLTSHLEAGFVIRSTDAFMAKRIITQAISSGMVTLLFSTSSLGTDDSS